MNQRTIQSKQIIEKENINQLDRDNFQVKSQTIQDKSYTVSRTGNGLICTCPDHTKGKSDCYHILAVLEQIKKNQIYIEQDFHMMDRTNFRLCKFCNSGNLKKDGIRKNKKGNVQQFKCLECKKRFTLNLGFEKMRYGPVIITRTLQMYYAGMSVRDVADCLKQENIIVSFRTVYGWIEKYSKMTSDYVKGIVPRVSEKWMTDEIYIKVRGKKKLQYTMMDFTSRYMITKYVAHTKYRGCEANVY